MPREEVVHLLKRKEGRRPAIHFRATDRTTPWRVIYGSTAADEMGDLWIQVLPDDAHTARPLERVFARKGSR